MMEGKGSSLRIDGGAGGPRFCRRLCQIDSDSLCVMKYVKGRAFVHSPLTMMMV